MTRRTPSHVTRSANDLDLCSATRDMRLDDVSMAAAGASDCGDYVSTSAAFMGMKQNQEVRRARVHYDINSLLTA